MNSGLITGGQNLSKRQTVFFLLVNPMDKEHKYPETIRPESTVHADSVEETSKHGVLGRHQICSKERIQVLSDAIERHHPVQYTPSLLYPEGYYTHEKVHESPRRPPKISLRNNWMRNWYQKLLDKQKAPNQPNQTEIQFTEQGDLLWQNNRPVRTAQEIDTRFSLDRENANLSVRKTKTQTKDVDAHRVRTGRPVDSHWSLQLEKIDIDFRMFRLQLENHSHWQDLQPNLQQSDVYSRFSEKSKKMIRDMGNVELSELCETIPKVQCSECLLYWNQSIVCCTGGHLLRENKSSRRIHRWQLDILSMWNYTLRKGDLMAIVMGRLKNKENTVSHII